MNPIKKIQKAMKNVPDPYKALSENALERFLYFINDSIELRSGAYSEEYIRMNTLIYLDICYKEKKKDDKTLPKNLVKIIQDTIKSNLDCNYKLVFCALFESLLEINTVY